MEESPGNPKLEPLTEERKAALRSILVSWEKDLKLEPLESCLHNDAGGILTDFELKEVFGSGLNEPLKVRKLIDFLRGKSNDHFDRFCKILEDNDCEHRVKKLKDEVKKKTTDKCAEKCQLNKTLNLTGVKIDSDKPVSEGSIGLSDMKTATWEGIKCTVKVFKDPSNVGANKAKAIVKQWKREVTNFALFLKHRNIVQIYGITDVTGTASVVMEHLNVRLDCFLTAHKTERDLLPLALKRSILRDVASAMRYLHSQDIMLRTLNADSIMLNRSMVAKIADFGLSRKWEQGACHTLLERKEYIAPEALTGSYNRYCDCFSFGCLIIHVITHEDPIPKPNGKSEYNKRSHLLESVVKSRYEELPQVVEKCLMDEPEDRLNFHQVLQEIREGYSDDDVYGRQMDNLMHKSSYKETPSQTATATSTSASPPGAQASVEGHPRATLPANNEAPPATVSSSYGPVWYWCLAFAIIIVAALVLWRL